MTKSKNFEKFIIPNLICFKTIPHYPPFGSVIQELSYQHISGGDTAGYRYGFNGMERTYEIQLYGNAYSLGFREYESRLGRMFKIDPRFYEYPWQSPYVYHLNNPVNQVDYLGGGIVHQQLIKPQLS